MFHDVTLAPIGEPIVDVVTTAKTNLKAGEIIDGLGEYKTYGLCENIEISLKKPYFLYLQSTNCLRLYRSLLKKTIFDQ